MRSVRPALGAPGTEDSGFALLCLSSLPSRVSPSPGAPGRRGRWAPSSGAESPVSVARWLLLVNQGPKNEAQLKYAGS